jgi:UDP-glucose 4-epimerase
MHFEDKTLLITGGTGSFGNAVLRRFLNSSLREIRIFSRDEKKQDDMRKKYNNPSGAHVWNLGTGQGYSVLDMVRAFEAASGKPLPYRVAPRRSGDIATCYADPAKAERELGWKARRGLDEMMRDAWRWQSMNPDGYR